MTHLEEESWMPTVSRFRCPSSALELKQILGKSRPAAWVCLGLGIALHLASTRIAVLEAQQKSAKPLTTQFVKRQPRLSKPLELKKRPQPRRREVHRRMLSVKAKTRANQTAARLQPLQVLRKLASPIAHFQRRADLAGTEAEPRVIAAAIEGSRHPRQTMDLASELVDIEALNTGRYHAMVIEDPHDKRNLKGFYHLVVAFSKSMHPNMPYLEQDLATWQKLQHRLVDAMNRYTDIQTDLRGQIDMDDAELLKTPWVYTFCPFSFKLTESESANVGTYLCIGGFIFADTAYHWGHGDGMLFFYDMFQDALATQDIEYGVDCTFQRMPNSHPLYHCYFDFDGPPVGGLGYKKMDYLEELRLGNRVAAVLSGKWYMSPWGNWGFWPGYTHLDNTRQLQFAVNLIVFALTQEGSITHQLMHVLAH